MEGLREALTRRGLLRDDAPELFAAHEALAASAAKGEATADQQATLRARIEAFPMGREFVEEKLRRLNARVDSSPVAEARRSELARHSQLALSHLVSGRYGPANEALNAIAALLVE